MDLQDSNQSLNNDHPTTIQQEIYIRFLIALARVRNVKRVTDELLSEVGNIFFGEELTRVKLFFILNDNDYLAETAILTGLMEASKSWPEFEKLHQQQKDGEDEFQKIAMGISE